MAEMTTPRDILRFTTPREIKDRDQEKLLQLEKPLTEAQIREFELLQEKFKADEQFRKMKTLFMRPLINDNRIYPKVVLGVVKDSEDDDIHLINPEADEDDPGAKAKYYLKESKPIGVSKFGKFKIPLPDEFRRGKGAAAPTDGVSGDDEGAATMLKDGDKTVNKSTKTADTKTFAIRNVAFKV